MLEAGTLPVRELASLAAREGRRPKPIYGAHKWFARRLGTAFRALLVASALPEDGDFWSAFEGGLDLSGTTMLDPFVGGGTSVAEASRLGMTCLGTDVDPVAVAITSFQSRLASLPPLGDALACLREEVGAEVRPHHLRADGSVVLHHFWVQVVPCGGCGTEFDAHPHRLLAEEVGSGRRHAFCGRCGEVHELPRAWASFACRACGERTRVAEGTVVHGTATCPLCGTAERLIDVAARTGRPPRHRLFACEVVPVGPSARPVPMRERRFARAGAEDTAVYASASARLDALLADGGPGLPSREIPAEGRSDDRLLRYGHRRYADLFNARQRLHLLLLSRAILRMDAGSPVREALAVAFSDHLKANCVLASYALGYRRLSPLFALRAFRHVPRPVEMNPWVEGTGRGSFPNAVRSVARAAASVVAGREYSRAGGFAACRDAPRGPVDVRACGAADLGHVRDGSVDLVLTDPPYFDNIAYSELADFFHPWQRHLGLVAGAEEPGFPPEQLAAPSRGGASAARFEARLAACFARIAAKMRPGALAAFTYQHTASTGWRTLAGALAAAPLAMVGAFPLAGDAGANLHREDASICWDAVLVARRVPAPRRGGEELVLSPAAAARVSSQASRWARELRDVPGVPFRAADATNLRRALLLASALGPPGDPRARGALPLSRLLDDAPSAASPSPHRRGAVGAPEARIA